MDIHTNIPLKNYTTMKLGGNARFMTDVHSEAEVAEICQNAKKQNLSIFILGGGSNLVVGDSGFNGIVIRNRIMGFNVIDEDDSSKTIEVGGGEIWDDVVKKTVDLNLSGIEAMSLVPGTAGAAPVQNMGAYGQETADTLISLKAYDMNENKMVELSNQDCNFSYRNSIFKSSQKGRYFITSIKIKLSKYAPAPPFYESLQKYFDEHDIKIFTVQIIRDAVIELRKSKLPDPKYMPSAGSFFKNALVEKWQLDNLRQKYPDIPSYEMAGNKFKIPTGWLIEQAGLKGQLINGVRIFDKNALVLVNESAKTSQDLFDARDEIISKIYEKFGVQVEQEPIQL